MRKIWIGPLAAALAWLMALASVADARAAEHADAPVSEVFKAVVPNPDPLTPEQRRWFDAHGPVVYAPDPDFPPFEYFDSSGKILGITPDLVRTIGAQLGITVKIAKYPSWSKVLEAMREGRADLLGTLTRTPEREKFLAFTDPYLSVPYVLFVRNEAEGFDSVENLAGKRFAVVKGYGINTWLAEHHPELTPIEVATTREGMTLLSSGGIDAMLETLPVGSRVAREQSLTNVKIAPARFFSLPQHFGISRKEPELFGIVQKGLQGLSEEQKTAAFVKWTGQDFQRQPEPLSPFWRNAMLGLVAVLLIGFTWNWALRRSIERATRAQRASEERYNSLISLAADAILQGNPDGVFLVANKSAEKLTGYSAEELHSGFNIRSLFGEDEMLRAPLRFDLLREGRTVRTERLLTRKDGSVVPVDMNTNMMPDGTFQTFMRDMSEQKRTEETLRASEEKFATAFRNAPVMLSISSLDGGLFVDANEKFCRAVGYAREELIGKSARDVPFTSEAQRQKVYAEVLRTGSVDEMELEIYHRDGSKIDCVYSAGVFTLDGKPYFLSIGIDVSEKKRLQEELNKTQRLESLGLLAGGIAHDFNNLLTGILGNLSLAKTLGVTAEPALKCLDECEKASLKAAALVSQLLTFSRGGTPKKRILRLAPLVEEATGLVLRGSGTRAVTRLSPDLLNIEADEGQIGQALHNLLLNAAQAMDDRGIVTVTAENIFLEPGNPCKLAPGSYVRLEVEDRGPGIPASSLAKIFDPYYTTKTRGTGLGLATVHSIITRHLGHIGVDNVNGGGARFTIHLPATATPAALAEEGSREPAARGSGRVLVMDDEEIIRDLVTTMLNTLGYEPSAVADGAGALQAVEEAERSGSPFVAAILDLTVPGGMGGVEAAAGLKAFAPGLKLLVSSGYSDDETLAEYGRHGFDGAIPKPYKLAELGRELKKALG